MKKLRQLVHISIILLFTGCAGQAEPEPEMEIIEESKPKFAPVVFPQLGHSGAIKSVVFSYDGRRIYSGAEDRTVKIWDAVSGREIITIPVRAQGISSAEFNPDVTQFISDEDNKYIESTDIAVSRLIKSVIINTGNDTPAAFSRSGKYLLSVSRWDKNYRINLWDAGTGRRTKTFSKHSGRVNTLVFNSDGSQFISGANDRTVILWDTKTGRALRTFYGHSNLVSSAAFSPCDKMILSGSGDRTVKLWDAETGNEIRTFSGHTGNINSVIFSPDGKMILSGSGDRTVKLWDADSGLEIRTFSGHTGGVTSIAFNDYGSQIISGSSDRTVKLWDMESGHVVRIFSADTSAVTAAAYSSDGRQILSGYNNAAIKLWDTAGSQLKNFSGHKNQISSLSFSHDNAQILSGSFDNTIRLWNAVGYELKTIDVHSNRINSAALSPDGTRIVSGLNDNSVKLFDTDSGQLVKTFINHTDHVLSVAYSPDGKHILSGSYDNTVILWDAQTGRPIRISGRRNREVFIRDRSDNIIYENWISSVAFSPDGKYSASGSNTVSLMDAAKGSHIRNFVDSFSRLYSWFTPRFNTITFSPGSNQILSGSNDGTVILWDVETGREIKAFTGHTNSIFSTVFNPDGRLAISGSSDGTLRLWDIASGREIAAFISFTDGEWVVITPDGFYNASPDGGKHLNVRVGHDVYGIKNFEERFNRPDIVEARLRSY